MSDLRKSTGDDRLALKASVRRSITLAGGGDSVQHATRVDATSLSRYGSANIEQQKTHCPIDVALDLDLEAGAPVITTAMARAQNYELVPMLSADVSSVPWETKLCRLGQVRGELYGVMGEALSDGRFDAEEASRANAKIEEEIAQLRRIQARINAEGGASGQIVRMTGGERQ
ncbi:phage regulatory CII family protein [Antarcticirhabdus aurantiaca]|uniref:phage regulatory CII family protein n=1 Tax=Antarcticirhabdus aurantiaca TaxID=2606717 RepID=UPI00131DD85C|nr:phage regulatory CII family protein [Antarcticirhabdus aurantiaca]